MLLVEWLADVSHDYDMIGPEFDSCYVQTHENLPILSCLMSAHSEKK